MTDTSNLVLMKGLRCEYEYVQKDRWPPSQCEPYARPVQGDIEHPHAGQVMFCVVLTVIGALLLIGVFRPEWLV